MRLYLYRVTGAMVLDAGMYEGIEADSHTTGQAAITVLLSSLATGVAARAWFGARPGLMPLIVLGALVTWLTWALLIFEIGSRVLPGPETETSRGELLRTLGFAAAPGMLQVLGVIPSVALPIVAISSAWMFIAMVVAVRHALDYPRTGRAVLVCALAASVWLIVALGLGLALSRPVA